MNRPQTSSRSNAFSETEVAAKIRSEASGLVSSPPPESSSFYLFYSFDLAGSTRFKTIQPALWPVVVQKFYELVQDNREKRLDKAHFWKYVGDEVLLFKKVSDIRDIHSCVPIAYEILQDTIKKLHDTYPETKRDLSVKATLWCARTSYIAPHEIASGDLNTLFATESRNLLIYPDAQTEIPDFLGPDIDIGFRISKYAPRQRLVISADLAFLLWKERGVLPKMKGRNKRAEECFRIVSFQHLNGVWDGRGYPIIWYETDWENTHFAESFAYDEHLDSDFIRHVSDSKNHKTLDFLDKVFEDRNSHREMERFWTQIQSLKDSSDKLPLLVPLGPYAELHCVAVCMREDGSVLVAKRSNHKKRFKEKWEFGCGQLNFNESFEDCLKRSYKQDFNVELNFYGGAQPLKTFLIEDDDNKRVIPGVIFLASVVDPQNAELRRRESHQELRWLDPIHIDLTDDDCVPDSKQTIQIARATQNSTLSENDKRQLD